MPPSQPGGGAQGAGVPQGGSSLSGPVIRSMPEDLRRLSRPSGSVTGSGKVMWPSDASPSLGGTQPPKEESKGGFFSSLLQPKHHDETSGLAASQGNVQKIPVQGESSMNPKGSVWDDRVPPVHLAQQFPGGSSAPKSPMSALPIPQKPIVKPTPSPAPAPLPVPPSIQNIEKPKAIPSASVPVPQKPPSPPTPPLARPVVPPHPPAASTATIFSPSATPPTPPIPRPSVSVPSAPVPASAPQATKVVPPPPAPAPSPVPPSRQPSPTPVPVPRPVTPPKPPAPFMGVGEQIPPRPVSIPRPTTPPPLPRSPSPTIPTPLPSPVRHADDDIGIDLGISEYLKGGPTFQIDHSEIPIAHQAQVPLQKGGLWNPTAAPQAKLSLPATIFTPSPSSPAPMVAPSTPKAAAPESSAHTSPKPSASNGDLDTEKQRLTGERAQIAGAKSAIDAGLRSLASTKQQIEEQVKPVLLRETKLAAEIEELEKKEQGLTGEVRRAIERDRWTKVEERRKVEQERILIKKRQIGAEEEMHGKEEEQVSLVKREKDIDARIVWIDGEYKRRDVRMRLAEVNQEKTNIESHRSILDNGIKRLKASLEETERNERRLAELKRSLTIKMPQNIAEEERFAQERFDIEKQIHDMELRRWSLEDEMKHATELFAKEDMAYLDVMHRAESLERELKGLG